MNPLRLLYRRVAYLIAMLTLTVGLASAAGQTEITGIVVDETGEPLPGATVREITKSKDASVTTVITDAHGHFSLNIPDGIYEIEVSFIGYKTANIKLDPNQNLYKIALQTDTEQLEEVVVTGYQTISKERVTGSFAKVDRKQLENQRINSVEDMLEGHVAGYTDGRIRGITSMNGVTTPLYVIDGFPVERTQVEWAGGGFQDQVPNINIDDVESITVLKDAAATSIYGARAANGVIVITTKKAQKGKVGVSASATFSVKPYKRDNTFTADSREVIDATRSWIAQNPNFSGENAKTYAENMLKNSSDLAPHYKAVYQRYAGIITEQQLNSTLDAWASQGYRWYDETDAIDKRDATTQRYNLSVTSSGERNSLVATISYNRDNYESVNSKHDELDISLRNTVKMTDWASLDLGASVIYTSNTTAAYSVSDPGFAVAPYMSFYNSDGSTIISRQEDRLSTSRLNAINKYGLYNEDIDPMDELGRSNTNQNDLLTRLYARLNFKITDWLKFTTQFQYEFGEFHTKQTKEKATYEVRNKINNFASTTDGVNPIYNLPYGDIYYHLINTQRAYNFRNQLEFNKTFDNIHDVTVIAGMEMRHNKNRAESNTLYGYDEQLTTWTMVNQAALSSIQGAIFSRPWISSADFASIRELTNRFISFYANAAYAYDNRYMLNASIRSDRTNLFGTSGEYQGKPIWSVGAAWRIDQEKFFSASWVNMLKLRTSYGIGGNIAKDTWPYLVAYYSTNT